MMRFADPWFLTLLIFIVPVVLFGRISGGRIRFSSLQTLKSIGRRPLVHPRNLLLVLRVLCLVLFVLAIARPQSGKTFTEVSSDGVDIVLALDTSRSMQALDFKIDDKPATRLDIVKRVVADFIDTRPADRIGLVVFGDEAFTQCPLTLDHGILLDFLKKVEIGMAGDATAIGSAIGVGIKRVKDVKAKSKIIILLTDGENTAGRITPLKAAELAKTFGVKVYTIGVGTHGRAPILVDTIFGKRYQYMDVKIDEKNLSEIANLTGGKYYRATDTQQLERIYEDIDKLEKTEVKVKQYTEYHELFYIFLLAAIIILLIEIVLAQTWLRKIP
jgi:Ca-activated chloride channel family protein